MTIDEFSNWLSDTAPSRFIQTTDGIIPALQTVHILCVATLFASALVVSLRVLGGGLRSEAPAAVARRFIPPIWVCLVVLLSTGLPLIVAEPGRTLGNPSFTVKLVAIGLAVAVTLALDARARSASPVGAGQRMLAVLVLLLWSTVIVAGRYIAYTS